MDSLFKLLQLQLQQLAIHNIYTRKLIKAKNRREHTILHSSNVNNNNSSMVNE